MANASSTTAPTQFVETKLEKYAYRRFGKGNGLPLLCLQHFTGTLDNWDPAVTDPLAVGREVILFESAGLGRSTGQVPANMTGMAANALAFVDALGLKRLDKEPEVVMTHSGIAVDVLGSGLDRISREKQQAILISFPRLAFKDGFKGCLCNVVRQKPMTAVDNILRDFGIRYVEGFTPPNFADLVAGAPFSE